MFFPRTRKVRDCDAVDFFPHDMPFTSVNLNDHLHQAADYVVNLLAHLPLSTLPSLDTGDPTRNTLLKLAQLLSRIKKNLPNNPAHHPTSRELT